METETKTNMKNKEVKRTITFPDSSYQIIKEYCDKNNLKIGGFSEKVLLDYIKQRFNKVNTLLPTDEPLPSKELKAKMIKNMRLGVSKNRELNNFSFF